MSNYWENYARQQAKKKGVRPGLIVAQIGQESGFDPHAKSPAGALGISQFMPDTARGLGIDPMNPRQAIQGQVNLMANYIHKYGSEEAALRAYNAGPGNIQRSHGFAETNQYVKNILSRAGHAGSSNPRKVSTLTATHGVPMSSAQASLSATSGFSTPSGVSLDPYEKLNDALSRLDAASPGKVSLGYGDNPMGLEYFGLSSEQPTSMLDMVSQIRKTQNEQSQQAESTRNLLSSMGNTNFSSPVAPLKGDGGSGRSFKKGKVEIFNPNPGRLSKGVVNFGEQLAGISGRTIRMDSGALHDKFVKGTNRVSEHFSGHATDIPDAGKSLTRLGQQALIVAGVPAAVARKQSGGLFNITADGKITNDPSKRKYQIIFNSNIGGNHFNHLHVGVR